MDVVESAPVSSPVPPPTGLILPVEVEMAIALQSLLEVREASSADAQLQSMLLRSLPALSPSELTRLVERVENESPFSAWLREVVLEHLQLRLLDLSQPLSIN